MQNTTTSLKVFSHKVSPILIPGHWQEPVRKGLGCQKDRLGMEITSHPRKIERKSFQGGILVSCARCQDPNGYGPKYPKFNQTFYHFDLYLFQMQLWSECSVSSSQDRPQKFFDINFIGFIASKQIKA